MAYLYSTIGYIDNDMIDISCDICNKQWSILLISAKRSIKKNGKHVCRSCKARLLIRPQNTKSYWTADRKRSHGNLIRQSISYYEAIAKRPYIGSTNNPMFGKQHSIETRQKMSNSRRGKIGQNATAWKGGKCSLTKRVKKHIHITHKWYFRCYQRDGFCCIKCNNKKKIEAHHIEPMHKLIKRLLKDSNMSFATDDERYLWLIKQPEIIDAKLENGITLCRTCHKAAHANWGSHEPK